MLNYNTKLNLFFTFFTKCHNLGLSNRISVIFKGSPLANLSSLQNAVRLERNGATTLDNPDRRNPLRSTQ